MPTSPDDSKDISTASIILLALLIIGVFIGMLVGGTYACEAMTEASASDYADVAKIADLCPTTKPMIKSALSDGRLTQYETAGISDAYQKHLAAYDKSVSVANARIALGLSQIPIAPQCLVPRDLVVNILLYEYQNRIF